MAYFVCFGPIVLIIIHIYRLRQYTRCMFGTTYVLIFSQCLLGDNYSPPRLIYHKDNSVVLMIN